MIIQGPRSVFLLGGMVASRVVRGASPLEHFESTTLENAIASILRDIGNIFCNEFMKRKGMFLSKQRKKIKSSKIHNGAKIIGGL